MMTMKQRPLRRHFNAAEAWKEHGWHVLFWTAVILALVAWFAPWAH
jgi:hypothetical protein